ncbi:MAG: LysM peptidoglycan-binding domain-containing protein [Candidatus Limnocylindria bacterium]
MLRRRQRSLLSTAVLAAVLGGAAVVLPAAATDRVVVVQRGDTLSQIAATQGVSVAELMRLNGIVNPNRIQVGQRILVAPPSASAPTSPSEPAAVVHRVASGEHLTLIAQRYGTTIGAMVKANGIGNPSFLRVGQLLTIPGAATPAAPSAPPSPSAPAAVVHRVGSGENLTLIAQRYGTTIGAMVKANGIGNPSFLRVGQLLTIPGAATSAGSESAMPSSMAALVTARDSIRQLIAAEATAQGVPVAFALALAWQESGWQPTVVSSGGAVGVMQLTPPTADWVASTMLDAPINLADPASNARAGVRLLRHYFDRYGGDRVMVLAAYYQGQTGADRHGVYPMTRPYIASILALEAIFSR